MTTDPTSTTPAKFTMNAGEVWTLPFDTAPYLAAGQAPASVVAAMTKVLDKSIVPLSHAASVVGAVIWLQLDGPADLNAGDLYRLRFTFQLAPSTDERVMTTLIEVRP